MSVQYQWVATPLFQLMNSIVSPVALFQSKINDDGKITLQIMEKNIIDVERETGECKYNPVCEVEGIESGNGWVEKMEKFVAQYLCDKIPGFNKDYWLCIKLRKLAGDGCFYPISLF